MFGFLKPKNFLFGVMDKINGLLRGLLFKWTKLMVFFLGFVSWLLLCQIFAVSSKTEVGSAGEQPARDSLMFEVNTSK
jgi:hypothetical protein